MTSTKLLWEVECVEKDLTVLAIMGKKKTQLHET